ncbi:ATPase PAAT isoform X1 [Brachyistius frenatus]|uniref:ATPase PAAT isoform X1 n=1 Tax=Brachyistius frenatus TaxID=100188 RepID=UPI0037E8629B
MVDISVKGEAGWVCPAQGRLLADVLLPVHVGNEDDEEQLGQSDGEETNRGGPVLLEQVEEGSPCVLTLHGGPDAIGRLLVVSEARTMEVYSQTGEYRGTVRGTRDDGVLTDRADGGPFYKKQLVLQDPSSACEVKLLSLAGRSRVLVCRVVVGLRSPRPRPARGAGIDMQRVQSLVEEMGRSLSPGAQNLMDMVQFQQKNQSGSLGGFLPLLMGGGALSAMARGVDVAAAADSTPPAGSFRPADDGGTSEDSAFSSPDLPLHCIEINRSTCVSSERRERRPDEPRPAGRDDVTLPERGGPRPDVGPRDASRAAERLRSGDPAETGRRRGGEGEGGEGEGGEERQLGAGRSHGAPSGGDGAEAEGAHGPAPGRSGAEAGEGPARRPAAGRPQPRGGGRSGGRSGYRRHDGAHLPDAGHPLRD